MEYITAGGLNSKPLPASLLREGLLMRDALIADLSSLNNIEIVTTVDERLYANHLDTASTLAIDASADPFEIWQVLIKTCDAALIVAPESDGILSKLTHMVEVSGVVNLGCAQCSVDIASNKYDTFIDLKSAGIMTIPTMMADMFLTLGFNEASSSQGSYVLKPIDGAGCEQTMLFKSQDSVHDWLSQNNRQNYRYIVQPFQAGIPASMSMLCRDGQAWLLSCNQQNMVITESQHLKLVGVIVNELSEQRANFERLSDRIALAMPTLNGYVGVDVILDENEIIVVEINPRITTSYIALSESLGCNPMRMMLDLADAKRSAFTLPNNMWHKSVSLSLNE
ncbi:MAG: ATP-grasp domain-containing protein [Methylophilales bacterium]|nr:ATP-grasp domain-containing protein [Methylophilales bacterium]